VKDNSRFKSTVFNLRNTISFALVCAAAVSVHANIITVTNTNDGGPGSLRQALADANDGDTITFAVTGPITLTSGGLPVTKNVTISGPGSNQLSVDGNQALFVFGIFPGKTATISGLSIRNGQAGIWNEGTLTVSDCVVSDNSYEGLYNDYGTATLSNCVVSGNSGTGLYGHYGTLTVSNCNVSGNAFGIYSDHGTATVSNCVVTGNSSGGLGDNGSYGPSPNDRTFQGASLTIADSTISNNSGPGVDNAGGDLTIVSTTLTGNHNPEGQDSGYGGGIYAHYSGKAPPSTTIINSTISGNSAFYDGGGISAPYLMIVNSTVSGNSAGDSGGGISGGGMVITNSTVSGNSAGNTGGGITTGGQTVLTNTTISGNSAGSGGGIYTGGQNSTLEICNTILNAGVLGENIFNNGGTVTSLGYNISSDNGDGYLNGPGDQINTDPLLGPLQDNGGPTLTHAPLTGSPAIDAGDPNFTPPPFRDQRGPCFHRVFGRRIDVGSVETQPQPRCPTPAPRPTP
jgi:predicted outer membrane repeat protein